MLARQAFYPLSHAYSPFCSGYFGDRVLLFAQASLDCDPPILAVAEMTGAYHIMPSFFSGETEYRKIFVRASPERRSSGSKPPT
jgi:hypothetical protein